MDANSLLAPDVEENEAHAGIESSASFVAQPADVDNRAPYFRREFSSDEALISARLLVTALGIVEPYLNGQRIGDEVLSPGWTSYRHRVMVSTYDVTDLVKPGLNAVGAIVGEGWAVGRLGWEGGRNFYTDRPALFMELVLEYADRTEIVGTDDTFQVGTGAVLENGIYDGETFDARLEPVGWAEAGFDDSAWSGAEVVEWDMNTLQVPSAPPIRRIEEIAPVAILTSPSGKTIVDFGQNISGWVRLHVKGEAGQEIILRHAEVLTPDGELEFETNRTAKATDRYVLRGEDRETWEPRFTFHGFRYAQVEGLTDGDDVSDALVAVVVHSDMVRTGWFDVSDPLLSQLHSNVVWSMRDNFVGVPTDCPQRDERLGWTGDINAFGPTAAYLYDVRGVLGSWLQDLAAEQAECGFVPWVVPDALSQKSAPTALWSDVAVGLPWTLYQEYGDLDILRNSYESMVALTRQIADLLDQTFLWSEGFQFGDWLDPDAPANNPAAAKTDRHLVATAFVFKTAREMAATAGLLGNEADAAEFTALAGAVREGFRAEFVTASGRLVNESATAYALAITFGLLDDSQLVKAGDRLAHIVKERGYRISTGFAGTPLVTDALSDTGHIDTAYHLLMEKESPSFLYPVTMGATTIWERWDSVLPDGSINATGMTSLNHYALGAVADWMHRVIGGLQRVEPGYKRVRIAPQPGGALTWARAAHDTVSGRIEVAWAVEDGEVKIEVDIPAGVQADVVLPLHPQGESHAVGEGRHVWKYPAPAGYGTSAPATMETPIREIAKDADLWQTVAEVLQRHFPGLPLDTSGPMAVMSLSALLKQVPGISTELEHDLASALNSQGRAA